MPIRVSDYTWKQTLERVTLTLDLHHTSPKKVDVFTTSSYLKVSFLPYICEVFLCHLIQEEKSSACFLKGCLEMTLVKSDPQMWEELGLKLSKKEMDTRRQQAIKDMEELEKTKDKHKKEESTKRERYAVSQQIVADDREREERKRMMEREKAEFFKCDKSPGEDHKQSLEASHIEETSDGECGNGSNGDSGGKTTWCSSSENNNINNNNNNSGSLKDELNKPSLRRRVSSTCSEEGTDPGGGGGGATHEADYDGDGEDSLYYSSTENLHHMAGKSKQRKWTSCSNRKTAAGREKESKKRSVVTSIPPVRSNGSITITHTPRVFPSPARESTHSQEKEWLEAQSIKSEKEESGNPSTQELNEEHFKKKAVTLFSSGDYQGCVNACTEGLRVNPSSPAFYSNRAAAQLVLRNLHHAIKDCSKALELLMPPTEENSNSRLLCHIRRGTALVQLSLLSEGLADYQVALQLSPENKALRKDVERIQSMLLASTDSNDDSGCEAEEKSSGERGVGNPNAS